jgi:hypothetical protein
MFRRRLFVPTLGATIVAASIGIAYAFPLGVVESYCVQNASNIAVSGSSYAVADACYNPNDPCPKDFSSFGRQDQLAFSWYCDSDLYNWPLNLAISARADVAVAPAGPSFTWGTVNPIYNSSCIQVKTKYDNATCIDASSPGACAPDTHVFYTEQAQSTPSPTWTFANTVATPQYGLHTAYIKLPYKKVTRLLLGRAASHSSLDPDIQWHQVFLYPIKASDTCPP